MKKTYALLIVLLASIQATASDFYWVGGNGNWSDFQHHWALSSGGNIFQTTVPSAFDNVIFDANSFPTASDSLVTVDVSIAYTNNLTFTTTQKVKFNYGQSFSSIQIYGSVIFTEGVDMGIATIYFKSANAGNTITAGKSKWSGANLYFDGIGGSWLITDSLTFAAQINLVNGVLDVTGKKMRCQGFKSESENTRGWKFANAQISIYNAYINTANLTTTWQQSSFKTDLLYIENDINFLVDTVTNYSTNNTIFKNISVNVFRSNTPARLSISNCFLTKAYVDSGDVSISESTISEGHFNNLSHLLIGGTLTTENIIFTGNSCSKPLPLEGGAPPFVTTIKQISGTFNFNFALIKNLQGTGGAVFQAINSTDLGNNSGINFSLTSSQTYYWVGDDGDGQNPNHWSLSSGGPPQSCIPREIDHVILDENSFSSTGNEHIISVPACANLDARNVTQNVYIQDYLDISGSLYLSSHIALESGILFTSDATGNKIDLNGAQMLYSFTRILFNGNGNWTLLDSLYAGTITFEKGAFYSNGFKVRSTEDIIYEGGSADFSYSVLEIKNMQYPQLGIFNTTKILITKAGLVGIGSPVGEIQVYAQSALNVKKIGKLVTHADATIGGAYSSSLPIDTLVIQRGTNLTINAQCEVTVDSISIIGSLDCKKQTFISSNYIQLAAVLKKTSGVVRLTNIALLSVQAQGGATFIADNSADLGGNTGWQIHAITPKTYYWINDGGAWEDENHWSLTSGGTGSGCIPGIQDHVIFNSQSFHSGNQTVTKNNNTVQISGLLVQNIPSGIYLPQYLYMYGNLELHPNIKSTNEIHFVGKGFISLNTNGLLLNRVFTSADTLKVVDDLSVNTFFATRGYVDIQEKKIVMDQINWDASQIDSLVINMKGSVIRINQNINIKLGKMKLVAQGSKLSINASNSNPIFMQSSTYNANKIILDKVEFLDFQIPDDYFVGYPVLSEAYIENLVVNSSAKKLWFTISSCEIQNFYLTVPSIVNAKNNSYIHTFQLTKNIETYSSFKVDYLRLEPGVKMTISSNDTISIMQYLDAVGNSSLPITMEASQSGQKAHLRCATGSICCAYLNLSNTNAFGGALFYAGPSSNNISNNTGWNFGGQCDILSIQAPVPGCAGKPITITTTHPSQITGFLWNGPNSFASNQQNITIPSLNEQTIGLYSLLAGGQTRKLLLVTEDKPDTIITENNSSIYFESELISSADTIIWFHDGTMLNDNHNNVLYPSAHGSYYATFVTPAGCQYRTNTIVYQGTILSTSSPVKLQNSILLKPVPVQDLLTVESPYSEITQFSVYNQVGKLLLQDNFDPLHIFQIDTSSLPHGIYLIKILTMKGEYAKQFVK